MSASGSAKNRGHVNENEFLTISCIVKGGNSTNFRWYKDGMLIDFSISPRGGYITTLISDSEGIIRSILYYARVKIYDQGIEYEFIPIKYLHNFVYYNYIRIIRVILNSYYYSL